MKRLLLLTLMMVFAGSLIACGVTTTVSTEDPAIVAERDAYLTLISAETLSGMNRYFGQIIRTDGDLALPFAYEGVSIVYSSRLPEIVSHTGVVTRPDSCWIHSRDQQGLIDYPNLNDNWPVVVDVTMTYLGQIRTAKLMFVVAPRDGYTCDKYLGTK